MLPTARAFAIICAIVLALSTSTSAATSTKVLLFSPWSSSGLQQGFTVSENVKGSCWIHSLASERADAWRCADYKHGMYDPCFVDSFHTRALACAEGPSSKRVTLLTVAKPLADNIKLTGELWGLRLRNAPWGLRLVNGDTCVFVTGATDAVTVEGVSERLNYACAKKTGWIIGSPDRTTAIWRASSVQWPEGQRPSSHVTRVGIVMAVF